MSRPTLAVADLVRTVPPLEPSDQAEDEAYPTPDEEPADVATAGSGRLSSIVPVSPDARLPDVRSQQRTAEPTTPGPASAIAVPGPAALTPAGAARAVVPPPVAAGFTTPPTYVEAAPVPPAPRPPAAAASVAPLSSSGPQSAAAPLPSPPAS